jgi:hypothetical protein
LLLAHDADVLAEAFWLLFGSRAGTASSRHDHR